MNLEWLFAQFREHTPRELWFALAAAYQAIAQDRTTIQGLVAEASELLEENGNLRVRSVELEGMVGIDFLTRLPNRYRIDEVVESEVAYAKRSETPLSVIFIDVDHFKDVNDKLGHDVGDAVLVELAKCFRKTLRDYDAIDRCGGEEFLGVLRNNTLEQASVAAERLRKAVADRLFSCAGHELKLTVSIGVAEWQCPEHAAPMIKAADAAMYRAKHAGRNRVVANKR